MNLADVKRVGVVGAGTMGHGIAINFALAGYPTLISDVTEAVLKESTARIRAALDLFVEESLISRRRADEAVSLINGYKSGRPRPAVRLHYRGHRRSVVGQARPVQPTRRALPASDHPGSNTSSLVLSDFGSDVKRQDKIVLTHYFAPPHIVPGVEVAKGPGTSDETYDLTCDLMTAARKVPIRLKMERPGYLLNTVQRALGQAATDLWAEGMASAEDIELGIISTFGFRMPHEGPMKHYDLAGLWRWPERRARFLGQRERADEAAPRKWQAMVHRPGSLRRGAAGARP